MKHQEKMTTYLAAFVAELVHAGIKDVVVSPGSRSTPLAMILAEHEKLRVHIHVDERSASFFALGIAKATGKPTAILCTSGTAAANYYPAIIESYYSRVPLVVLTADRPHELRDIGAPQTIDQIHLYGKHVKWFVEMAPPEATDEMIRYVRTVCARAVGVAKRAPAGPVHLNFPFREPLVPVLDKGDLFQLPERNEGFVTTNEGVRTLKVEDVEPIATAFSKHKKGIIVCGAISSDGFADAVVELSKKLQYPILADPLSQLRSGTHDGTNIVDTYDTILRNEEAKKSLKPEVIIRFGAMPVSKFLLLFLKENQDALHFVIDGGGGWRDPTLLSTSMIECDETAFCRTLLEVVKKREKSPYLTQWLNINKIARNGLKRVIDTVEINEGRIFYELAEVLPEGSTLFVGNSMPIRDLDTFFHFNEKSIRILANRGANGIDGIVSTALGASTACQPMYLIVGDLTFFHDLNGLLAAKLYDLNIKIIVINNNGGGIFSFLPQASYPKTFEQLFGTPLNLDFEKVVQMYDGAYELIRDWEHFQTSLKEYDANGGLQVFEVQTNRAKNLEEHRNLWNFVSREITEFLTGDFQ